MTESGRKENVLVGSTEIIVSTAIVVLLCGACAFLIRPVISRESPRL